MNLTTIFDSIPTPAYIIDEARLKKNGQCLKSVIDNTGCRILLAQKAFSNYDFYPMLSEYISGTEASGLYEARLGKEEMGHKEVHVFCGAYRDDEFDELLKYADHIVFNSPAQFKHFAAKAKAAGKSIGLRINPECSTQEGHEIYDPCARGSRLGTTRESFDREMDAEAIAMLDGIHFHTLCEQNSDALEITVKAVEEKFGDILSQVKWVNMGGGHHITRDDYDIALLERIIKHVMDTWKVQVYLEPGEAVALNAGYLTTRVLDIVTNNDMKIAIIDASAACHMPDVIEMPYTPPLHEAVSLEKMEEMKENGETTVESIDKNATGEDVKIEERLDTYAYTYRLGGPTCLSGDVVSDYCFKKELHIGDMLVFKDMAIYTTCKNNTFNGMPLPNIWKYGEDGSFTQLTNFGYQDFKYRLGR